MKKHIYTQIISVFSIILFFSMAACSHPNESDSALNLAESIMESHPDSALNILRGINVSKLSGKSRQARHALLTSMALDKNYIDTTTFDVLQPALDYYPDNGTPDERLKTFYYQGRVYQNAGNEDLAMQAFLKGVEANEELKDSLVFAHLLVAQGSLYLKQYKIDDFVKNNIKAANIYDILRKDGLKIKSYYRALDGAVVLKDKYLADSIVNICIKLSHGNYAKDRSSFRSILNYKILYGEPEEVDSLLHEAEISGISNSMRLAMARGYAKVGNNDKGLEYINNVKVASNTIDSLSYLLIRSNILENLCEYKKSLEVYKEYDNMQEIYQDSLLKGGLLFSEKKHEMEIESLLKLQKRDSIIKLLFGGIVLVICFLLIFYYRNNLNKAARTIAEQEANNLRLTRDNLRMQLDQLEEERNRLNTLLDERKEMAAPMQDAIRMRLEMLNSLLAKEITDNEDYATPYRKWIDSIHSDRKAFMKSTQMAFRASHPEFIKHLEDHSLTEDEIDYVCLYALGLRGKEVGEYIQLRRHYNVSSEIRRKLGIDEHSTNLGPYIRSLLTRTES